MAEAGDDDAVGQSREEGEGGGSQDGGVGSVEEVVVGGGCEPARLDERSSAGAQPACQGKLLTLLNQPLPNISIHRIALHVFYIALDCINNPYNNLLFLTHPPLITWHYTT